jgi:hypothetical protein
MMGSKGGMPAIARRTLAPLAIVTASSVLLPALAWDL